MKRTLFSRTMKRLKAIAASLALLGLLAVPVMPADPAFAASQETAEQLAEVRALLDRLHISGAPDAAGEADSIDGLIELLEDPYTDFYDEEEWNGFLNALDLNYAGIGMRVGEDEDGFIAVEIFRGSPAEAAGLRRGDYIVAIGDELAADMAIEQVTGLIRGAEGTEVTLRIRRGGEELEVSPVRGRIHLPTVSGGKMEGGVGYINIDSFSDDADEQFATLLSVLKRGGINGLVVDLRDNPGGILETAQRIAEQFIPEGILIHTRDRNNLDIPVTIENGRSVEFPVVLLVNENSASASEVLTAALQDYGKAIAIGAKTYGKGSVQGLYELSSGGVLKVTVEEYLSPNKREVNKVGLMPDIPTEGTVPQLLLGLHAAGAERIVLEMERHLYRVNGFEFYDAATPVLSVDGRLYMPARTLAAAAGQPLEWDEALRGVVIGTGAEAASFDAASGFLLEGGAGFIELNRFKDRFPQTEWTSEDGKTVLTVKGIGSAWGK